MPRNYARLDKYHTWVYNTAMKQYITVSVFTAIIFVSAAFVIAPFVQAQSPNSTDSANGVQITPVVISLVANDLYQFTFTTSPVASARLAFGQSSVAVPNASAHAYGYSSVTEFDAATTTQTFLIRLNRDVVNYFRPVMIIGDTTYFGDETFLSIFHPAPIAKATPAPVKLFVPDAPLVVTPPPVIVIDTIKENLSASVANADDDVISSGVRHIWNWLISSIFPAN